MNERIDPKIRRYIDAAARAAAREAAVAATHATLNDLGVNTKEWERWQQNFAWVDNTRSASRSITVKVMASLVVGFLLFLGGLAYAGLQAAFGR